MRVLCAALAACWQHDFRRGDGTLPDQPGISVQITRRGFQRYIEKNVNFSSIYIQNLVIDDFDVALGSYKFSFHSVQIKEFRPPLADFRYGRNTASIKLTGIFAEFAFQFTMRQSIYPYAYDSGNGTIVIQNMSVQGQMSPLVYRDGPPCPGHYGITIADPQSYVDSIVFHITGNNAFLYNSLLTILASVVREQFNSILGQQMISKGVDIANEALQKDTLLVPSAPRDGYFTDQRFYDLYVDENFLTARSMSQIAYGDQNAIYDMNKTVYLDTNEDEIRVGGLVEYNTNGDIQYKVHRLVFQSLLSQLYQHKSHGNEIAMQRSPRAVKFVNNGLIIEFNLTGGVIATYLADIRFTQRNISYKVEAMEHRVVVRSAVDCSDRVFCETYAEDIHSLVNHWKQLLDNHTVDYVNANQVHQCSTVYVDEDNVLGNCFVDS